MVGSLEYKSLMNDMNGSSIIRSDLTPTEIDFINKDDKCSACEHLDMFHDGEVGMCLVDDCKEPRCGRE